MAFSLLALAGLAALIVVVAVFLFSSRGASRAMPIAIGLALLAVLGAAGFFFLSYRAPTRAPVVAVTPTATATAPVSADSIPTETGAPVRAVRGRVLRGAEGEVPVPGAAVEVFPATGGSCVAFLPPLAAVATEPDGTFSFEGVPVTGLRLRAAAPGCASAVVLAKSEDSEVVVRLLPGTFLAGRVFDADTKAALPGARVSVGDAAGAVCGPEGAFRIEGAPRGRVLVAASAPGYARRSDGLDLPEWGRTGHDILLRAGGSVAGVVLGVDGKPAPGAVVRPLAVLKVPVAGEVVAPVDAEAAISGADGVFLVEGLPAKTALRLVASTSDALSEPVDVAALAKGEARTGVEIRLAPGAAFAVEVRDGAGAPIAGVSVTAADPDEGGGRFGMLNVRVPTATAPGVTGADGRALVRPVVPGPKTVRARKDDWRNASAPAVAVAGQEIPVSLVLEPGASVSGRVQDPDGAPIAGAEVSAMSFAAGDASSETRTTAEDGTFRIGGLPGRASTVRAGKRGYVSTSANNVQPGTTDVVLTLAPGGTIVGTVTEPDGKPSPRFRAMAKPEGRPGANPMDWQRFASESAGTEFHDGRFRIEGVEPGSWTVEARADRFAPGRAAGVAVEARKETEVAIVLSSGVAVEGVVVRKSDGSPVAGARVRVPAEGIFGEFDMDLDLGALEDVASEELEQSRSFFGAFGKGEARSGADGRFRIEGLEPGALRLMVSAKGFAPQTARGLKAPSDGDVRIELGEEAAIEGVVTDMRGAPKAGVTVMIQRIPVFMRFGSTDEEGRYRVGGLGGGTYLFYVMEPGAALNLNSESVLLKEGETTRKDHRIGDGTRVFGRVTRGGAPVSGVAVMLVPTSRSGGPMGMLTGGGGGGFSMGSTKDDGTYEINGVSPGRYAASVQTTMGGNAGGGETVDVPRNATEVKHDIALPEAAIRGIVVDAQGAPVVGAAITALDPSVDPGRITDLGSAMQGMGGQTFSDDAGRFRMADMKPGTYRLRVQAEGRGTEIVENVSSSSGAEVRVVMGTGVEFKVRVVTADGAAVRGANVFLEDAEGRELTNLSGFDAVRTGEDGRAVVRAPPGPVTVEAAARGWAPGSARATVPTPEDVVVTLRPGATIRAKVVTGGGAPVPGAGIEVLDSSGSPLGHRFSMEGISDLLTGSTTSAEGTWVRADLPAGSWKVRVATQDGRTAEQSVGLAEGETAEITLRLP
jgi:hypothetical protein